MSAEAEIKSFVDRVLRLKEEQDALTADIREIYAEAKGRGFDKTALGQVVAHVRKVDKRGRDAVEEQTTIFDMYLTAYEGTGTPVATHTHEAKEAAVVIEPAERSSDAISATHSPDPRTSGGAGGHRSIPSVDAGDADRADEQSGHQDAKSTQAATHSNPQDRCGQAEAPSSSSRGASAVNSDDREARIRGVLSLRPHCQHPGEPVCPGYSQHHCRACLAAARESEVAA